MDPGEKNFTPGGPNLALNQINDSLKELGFTEEVKSISGRIEGTEALKGKTIVMIDDGADVLKAFVPDLVVSTEGKATFIRHQDQKFSQLISQILEKSPDIILLDQYLSHDLEGTSIAHALRESGFSGTIIGFSSLLTPGIEEDFLKAGASGAIEKDQNHPAISIKKIADFVAAQQK